MATPNSTVNARSRRNPPPPEESDEDPFRNPLEGAIERERARLWQAQAVLECLGLALLNADDFEGAQPNYSDAAKVAHRLVGEAIEQLDSVNISPLVRKCAAPRTRSKPARRTP